MKHGAQPQTRNFPALTRQVFEISRALEYFSESELVTQTGYPREQWWPGASPEEDPAPAAQSR